MLFRVLLSWSTAAHQLRSQTAPNITRACPAPHYRLTIRVDSSYHIFSNLELLNLITIHLGRSHSSRASSYSYSVFRISCTGIFLCLLLLAFPVFLWLRRMLLTIAPFLQQTVKASCVLQSRVNLLSLLLNCAGPYPGCLASIQHCTISSLLIRPFVAFRDQKLRTASLPASPSWSDAPLRVRPSVVHIVVNNVQIFQINSHKPHPSLRDRCNSFLLSNPVNDSAVVHTKRGGTDNPTLPS